MNLNGFNLKKKWRDTEVWLSDNGIIKITPTEDVYHELEDIVSFKNFIIDLAPQQKAYLLTDLRFHDFKLSKEAMKYAATHASVIEHTAAQAFLISSLPNRLIIRFFINTGKPAFPVKIFKTEDSALEWITTLQTKGIPKVEKN